MRKLEKLGKGIYMLDAMYVESDIASIYLIKQKDKVAIVETGTVNSIVYIEQALKKLKLNFSAVNYIIPTHVHLDHAAGAGGLMQLCPNAKLVIHPFGARHMIDPSKLIAGTKAVYGDKLFNKLYKEIIPIDANKVIEAGDNFKLNFNGRKLKFIDTPGHAKHHFCVWDKKSKMMFTGDTFGVSYREFDTTDDIFIFPTTTPVQFEPNELIKSIDRIMSYKPRKICLTHFGAISPEEKTVEQLKTGIAYMTDIACEHYKQADAENKIQEKVMRCMLEQLEDMGTYKDLEFCQEKLMNDVKLNTKGLMVWMARTES